MPISLTIIFIIVGLIAGVFGGYLLCYFIVKAPQIRRNDDMEKVNMEILAENIKLRDEKISLYDELIKVSKDLEDRHKQIHDAIFKIDEVKEEAEAAKQEFLQTNLNLAKKELEERVNDLKKQYEEAEDSFLKEYLSVMADMAHEADDMMTNKRNEYDDLASQTSKLQVSLTEQRELIDTMVESRKRAEAEKAENNFYRLILSKEDLAEIESLKTIIPRLRDPLALNKAIWKVYYEKPYTALIGRVLGANNKTGIYKITNIKNGMSYVGQAVDVAERWKQHIKRGMGAEAPTRNKLYPAMQQEGVENFTFELLVECPKEELNDKEDIYQEIFHCKDYGYSIK